MKPEAKEKHSLLLVDDHDLFRDGLKMLIRQIEFLDWAGAVPDGKELRKFLRSTPVDIVLMDVSLPDEHGADLAHYITRRYPGTRVVGLSMHGDQPTITRMLDAGAVGYLTKGVGYDQFKVLISEVLEGNICVNIDDVYYYSARIDDRPALDKFIESISGKTHFPIFTHREIGILRLMADGYTNKQMAEKLGLSIRTVETHRANILKKSGMQKMTEVIRYAIQHAIV